MDAQAHKRFLDYLEACSYFCRSGAKKLDRDAWLALDAELAELAGPVRPEEGKALDAVASERLCELRKLLFRD